MWQVLMCTLLVAVAAGPAWGQAIQSEQKTVFLNEHQVFEPGYAVGNLVIGSPDIADYKVLPGRRQLLIFGKGAGKTSFTIWDQNNVKRHEIVISVMTREDAQAESDLRELLKDYPAVGVRRLRGELVVTGNVDTEQDLEMVGKIAAAGGAQNLVRVNPAWARSATGAPGAAPPGAAAPAPAAPTGTAVVPGGAPAAPGAKPGPATPPGAAPKPGAAGAPAPGPATAAVPGAPPAPARAPAVVYEVELMEASSRFRTGTYETGTQPSGSRLFRGEVTARLGEDGVLLIPASAVFARDPKKAPKGESGIRLRLRPNPPDRAGAVQTLVVVETNLPVDQDSVKYDGKTWRRSRWEVAVNDGLPFAIAGTDLLAIADPSGRGSQTAERLGQAAGTASTVSGLPGVSEVPEAAQAGSVVGAVQSLFGLLGTRSEPPPTHLLVLVRPQFVPAAAGGK